MKPRIAHLLGLEDGNPGDEENLFSAWRIFLERLAEQHPTVLVFEDVQWADAGLLDFIEYLLDWSRNQPLYVIALARPEFAEKRSTWAGKRGFTQLYLEPLPPAAMGELLTGLVPGLPDDLRERVLERAEGVPLFAVETVRMLLDREMLTRDGDVYRPTGPIEHLEMPETLHALVAARPRARSASRESTVTASPRSRSRLTIAGLEEAGGSGERDVHGWDTPSPSPRTIEVRSAISWTASSRRRWPRSRWCRRRPSRRPAPWPARPRRRPPRATRRG